jgi:hypothetical protein
MSITLLVARRDLVGLLLIPSIGCLIWSAVLLAGAVAASTLEISDLGRTQSGFAPVDAQAAGALLCWLPAPIAWGWQALRVQQIRGAKLGWTVTTAGMCLVAGFSWLAATVLGLGVLIAPGLIIFAGGVYMPAVAAAERQPLPWRAWTRSAKLLTGGHAQPMTLIGGLLLLAAGGQIAQAAFGELAGTSVAVAAATPMIVTVTGVFLAVMYTLAAEAE